MNLPSRSRRRLVAQGALALGGLWLPTPSIPARAAARAAGAADRVLVLVELKVGNDGLNTVVPHTDPMYRTLRPTPALAPNELIALDERCALHASLRTLMPLWEAKQMAVLQGVGYPQPNLSHFRSIEIWETASASRATRRRTRDRAGAARGLHQPVEARALGGCERQCGAGARAARRGRRAACRRGPAWHAGAVVQLLSGPRLRAFAAGGRASRCRAARQGRVPVFHVSPGSFDTHRGQAGTYAALLRQLAEGLAALREALVALDAWERTLVLTYAEFGRGPRQNESGGTDHGSAAPHFALGGAVRGGPYGTPPALEALDGGGNLHHAIDFRQVYAAFAARWWGIAAEPVVRGRFDTIGFLAT